MTAQAETHRPRGRESDAPKRMQWRDDCFAAAVATVLQVPGATAGKGAGPIITGVGPGSSLGRSIGKSVAGRTHFVDEPWLDDPATPRQPPETHLQEPPEK